MFQKKLIDKRILIVEDDEGSKQLLFEFFSSTGAELFYANNGNDAISVVKTHPSINLILMDIKLPEKDGLFATKEIRKFNNTVPIIAQSAYAFIEDIENVKSSGMNDFISKPYRQKEILELVLKHIS